MRWGVEAELVDDAGLVGPVRITFAERFGQGHDLPFPDADGTQGGRLVAAEVAAVDDPLAAFPEVELDVLVLGADERFHLSGVEMHEGDAHLAGAERGEEGQVFAIG